MKLKQFNLPFIGAFIDSLYSALPLLSIINFVSIITVLYASIREYLLGWVPWLTLGWFVGILVILTIVVMACIYIFVLKSLWTFRKAQMNIYGPEIVKELQELRKEVAALKNVDNATTTVSSR